MASKMSPGGALLRSSRMFSLPKPIPPAPSADYANVDRKLGTSPYPTHQAITTLEGSRKTGDWGLKRPLPLKPTTGSSTPSVRVKHIDSIENITDYASASAHSLSLQKFQELNIPLTIPAAPLGHRSFSPEKVSVFEEDIDCISNESSATSSGNNKRWKFQGPWLAGLTDGQFNDYVRKTVRHRRQEFREFLKQRLASETNAAAQQQALEKAAEAQPPVLAQDITDVELSEYIRKLRADRVTLFSIVSDFLDLAPLNPPTAVASMSVGARIQTKSPNPYAERGPPITHPSAGLSYLRTAAHAENHPIYGPQAHPPPVLARIISPRVLSANAKLGVGGFVTDPPQGDSAWNARPFRGSRNRIPGLANFDPNIEGGAKAYVEPRSAYMNSAGRVVVKVDESSEEAQLIAKEWEGKGEIYNSKTPPVLGESSQPQRAGGGFRSSPLGRRPFQRRAPESTNGPPSYGLNKE